MIRYSNMSVLQQGAAPPVGTGQKQLLGRRPAGASSTADTVTDDPDLGKAILETSRAEDAAVQQRVTRSSANASPANSANASPAKSQTTSPARGKARSSTSQQPTTVHEEEEEKEKEEEEQQVSTRRTRGAVAQPDDSKSPSKKARKRA